MFYASYHVPGSQDDGSSPHVTAAAAARAVQSLSRRFETHVVLGALKKHREKKETRWVSSVKNSSYNNSARSFWQNSPWWVRNNGGVVTAKP